MIPPDAVVVEAKKKFETYAGTWGSFENALLRCLTRGSIAKTRTWFAMGERVFIDSDSGEIKWNSNDIPNCWFVWYWGSKSGHSFYDVRKAAEDRLPYIAWNRRGKIRYYTWEQGEKHGR